MSPPHSQSSALRAPLSCSMPGTPRRSAAFARARRLRLPARAWAPRTDPAWGTSMPMPEPQQQIIALFGGIGAVLVAASALGVALKTSVARGRPHGGSDNMNARIRAWWVMVLVSGFAFLLGRGGLTLLFLFVSFVALREFIAVTSARAKVPPPL